MRRFGIVGLALAAALVLAVPTARPDTHDAWLTTKIKIALLTSDGVSASAVNVDSQEGTVTIHGKVKTADEKAKAESVARQVDGVKDVKNLLQVVPEAEKEIVKASAERQKFIDAEMKKQNLSADASFDAAVRRTIQEQAAKQLNK